MLKIFDNLFKALHAADVTFCNWKGHHAVQSHLNGDGDLDLFVPLRCNAKFVNIIESQGFRRVISYQADHDFIEHYYALDKTTNKFAHIHVYFKIVTGEHASKNYILPLEEYILNNLDTSAILPIVNVGGRHNIFLIRYFLKMGSLYGLFQYWREIAKYSKEWNSYNHDHQYEGVAELALSSEELYEMKSVYEASSLFKKLIVSLRFKRRLRSFKKRGYLQHRIYVVTNFIIRLVNKLFFKKQKLLAPGIVVSVCGLDGSGKSSLVSALSGKYSRHFCVKVFHLGRPASNVLTFFFKPLISTYSFLKRNKVVSEHRDLAKSGHNISIIYAIRSVLLAYDRKVAAIKAHKYSQNGYLVICDRYPGLGDGKMDSPRVPLNESKGSLYQFFYNLEQKLYRSIKPANIIFQLSVPLEIAIDRNNKREKIGKETEDELRERFALNSDAVFLADNYKFIDATVSFDNVFCQVTDAIWFSEAWNINGRLGDN
jgi:thymidylate kinase